MVEYCGVRCVDGVGMEARDDRICGITVCGRDNLAQSKMRDGNDQMEKSM